MYTSQNTSSRIVLATSLAAVIGSIVAFFISPSAMVTDVISVHLRAATAILVTITTLGGSLLFLGGIKQFKTQMRIAYRFLAGGIMLFGIALIQLPIIGFLNLWNSFWANSGLVILPFVFATSLIYFGVRKFAIILVIKQYLLSPIRVYGLVVAGTVASYYAGRYIARYHYIEGTDLYIATVGFSAICLTCATVIVRRIIAVIGPYYQQAMQDLFVALVVLSIGAWHEYIINFFMNNNTWYVSHGLSFAPFIVSGCLILRAGYSFALLGKRTPFIPVEEDPSDVQQAAFVQTIAAIASLVPTTESTNSLLRDVQQVTTESLPTPRQQEHFVAAYRQLEQYLTKRDPLRSYDRDELRSKLRPELRNVVEQGVASTPRKAQK